MTTPAPPSTKDFLARTPAFTVEQFARALPADSPRGSAKQRLDNALRNGWVDRVTRGVYVSRVGVFADRLPDAFLLASKLGRDATISHASALAAHGLSHDVLRRVTFVSPSRAARFAYRGYTYVRLTLPPSLAAVDVRERFTTLLRAHDLVALTTRERTLVDCLAQPRWSGGLQHLFRSVGGVPAWDAVELLAYLDVLASPTVVARTAWALTADPDHWRLGDEVRAEFSRRLELGPYYLGDRQRPMRFVSEWRLYVPADADPDGWLNG